MNDATLAKWLQEELEQIRAWVAVKRAGDDEREVLDALTSVLALLREAADAVHSQHPLQARLRVVLGP